MRRIESREVQVTYCDVCGEEIFDSVAMVLFNRGAPNELHACNRWNEAKGTTCSKHLAKLRTKDNTWACGNGTEQLVPVVGGNARLNCVDNRQLVVARADIQAVSE